MPTDVQLVVDGGIAFAMVVFSYRQGKAMLFPPSALEGRVVSPAERAEVERAELVVRHAVRSVRWPVMAFVFVTTIVSSNLLPPRMATIVCGGGLIVGLAWQAYGMRRWWRWALQQRVDLLLVEELVEDATLVWGRDSWWGRRQRRTWMQLPPETGAQADRLASRSTAV